MTTTFSNLSLGHHCQCYVMLCYVWVGVMLSRFELFILIYITSLSLLQQRSLYCVVLCCVVLSCIKRMFSHHVIHVSISGSYIHSMLILLFFTASSYCYTNLQSATTLFQNMELSTSRRIASCNNMHRYAIN